MKFVSFIEKLFNFIQGVKMQHFQNNVANNVVIRRYSFDGAEGTLCEALFKAHVLGNDGP